MLTRQIDAALSALSMCRDRLPALSQVYREGSVERSALDELIGCLGRVDEILSARAAHRATQSPPA